MNKPKLYIILITCFATLTVTKGMSIPQKISQDSSIHKSWKWQSFKSLTRASINIQKFDLDLSSMSTLMVHLSSEEISSMQSTVDNSTIQKTRKANKQDTSEVINSSYQIIDNALIINDERFKNKITYKIKSLSANELVLIMHVKINSEGENPLEGDVGEITLKN